MNSLVALVLLAAPFLLIGAVVTFLILMIGGRSK